MSAFDEDAVAPQTYDWRILRRLLAYLRPHLAAVAAALALIVALAGIDLVPPYLTKVAIDRYIAKGDASGLAVVAGQQRFDSRRIHQVGEGQGEQGSCP